LVDTLEAENEDLHEKVIRERIKTYEANSMGSVHVDVCFVHNLAMRDKLCQRNYKISIDVVKTSVFPQIIEAINPRIRCLERSKSCMKFCIKQDDLSKINVNIAYDIK